MVMVLTLFSVVICLGSLVALPAQAAQWNVMKDKSTLIFSATQNNATVEGQFKSFQVDIRFDPNDLSTGYVKVMVDMNSVSAGYDELMATLKMPDWFSVQSYPQAIFEGKVFSHLEGQHYAVKGLLTVRDKTVPLTVAFELQDYQPDHAKAIGKAILSRTAMGVGQGQWQDTKAVKDEVAVSFVIDAMPQLVK